MPWTYLFTIKYQINSNITFIYKYKNKNKNQFPNPGKYSFRNYVLINSNFDL